MLGHVREQANIAVGQGADDKARFQPCQARHHIGPGVEPVPGGVEVLLLPIAQVGDAKVFEHVLQNQAVQVVNQGPAQFA